MTNTQTKQIPKDWHKLKISDFGSVVTGKTPSTNNPEFWGEDFEFVTPSDIKGDFKFLSQVGRNISTEGWRKLNKLHIPESSVIVTCIGSDMGKVIKNKKECITNQQINSIIVNNENDSDFIYYLLKNSYKTLRTNAEGGGSTMPIINKTSFENLIFEVPPLPEQRAIAAVLSSLDDKIELLRKENETLEAIAQTLFKRWFVDFNFPDKHGKPYKENGGRMVESELGEIPEGWRVFKLDELVKTVNGYSYKSTELMESDTALVTLKSFDRNGGFKSNGFKEFVGKPKASQEVLLGDLVVAHTDLTQDAEVLGNPVVITENPGYSKMYISMDLVKVISINDYLDNSFLYFLLKDRRFKLHAVGYSNGTTVLHLSKKAIPEYNVALPKDLKLGALFSDLSASLLDKIKNNQSQIQTLSNLRDTLLPKLMSGEVRVKY